MSDLHALEDHRYQNPLFNGQGARLHGVDQRPKVSDRGDAHRANQPQSAAVSVSLLVRGPDRLSTLRYAVADPGVGGLRYHRPRRTNGVDHVVGLGRRVQIGMWARRAETLVVGHDDEVSEGEELGDGACAAHQPRVGRRCAIAVESRRRMPDGRDRPAPFRRSSLGHEQNSGHRRCRSIGTRRGTVANPQRAFGNLLQHRVGRQRRRIGDEFTGGVPGFGGSLASVV